MSNFCSYLPLTRCNECRQEVVAVMQRHDAGGKGYLTREEFTAASQDIFSCVFLAARRAACPAHLPARAC